MPNALLIYAADGGFALAGWLSVFFNTESLSGGAITSVRQKRIALATLLMMQTESVCIIALLCLSDRHSNAMDSTRPLIDSRPDLQPGYLFSSKFTTIQEF
jgi:hypothetical protein